MRDEMIASFWRDRQVLVTGHTGFKGAWLTLWLQLLGARVTGMALHPEHSDAAFPQMGPWDHLDSRMADLRDEAAVDHVVTTAQPEIIFHLGAQALVLRGYDQPVATFDTNVLGTAHVLEAARRCPATSAVVVVTSDKVYANTGAGRAFTEDDPLGGTDPYSASKAAAEHCVQAWRAPLLRDVGVAVATVRAGNVVGGGDRGADRLVPDVLRALAEGRPVALRHPEATRPWQFVLDPLAGYLAVGARLLAEPGTVPPAVNFGPEPEAEATVAAVVDRLCALWGGGSWKREPAPPRPEPARLRLDPTLAEERLGWRTRLDLDTALAWTVAWQRALIDGDDMRKVSLGQLDAFQTADDPASQPVEGEQP